MINLKEHHSIKYAPRTQLNAQSANFTIAFATDMTTAGEILTKRVAGLSYMGYVISKEKIKNIDYITTVSNEIIEKIKKSGYKQVKINFAGNGAYTLNKFNISQGEINLFMLNIVKKLNKELIISKIISGGQTGVDFSAIIAANILNLNADITFPKGFLQRTENNQDVSQTKEEIVKSIEEHSKILLTNENNNDFLEKIDYYFYKKINLIKNNKP